MSILVFWLAVLGVFGVLGSCLYGWLIVLVLSEMHRLDSEGF